MKFTEEKIAVKTGSNFEKFNLILEQIRGKIDYHPMKDYKEELCIPLNDGCYADSNYYRTNGWKIIPFQEFESKYLNKQDYYENY